MTTFFTFQRSLSLLMVVVLLALLSACGGAMEATPAADRAASFVEQEVVSEEAMAPAEPGYADSGGAYAGAELSVEDTLANAVSQAQSESRVIIYTGDMNLVVKDTQESIRAITQLAGDKGGYVSGSNVYQSGEVLRGSITIRVPAELYQETLSDLRALAIRVERESSNSQDVTEEFTDLQARKKNLEFTETALQELLEERRRTGNTSDILEVYRELTNIRGQIEQIEGRLRYLTNQAALSTISIELIPDVLYQPVSVAGWEPQGVAKEALQSLVAALQGLVNIGIWLVIFALPLLIIVLIPLAVVIMIIRWWVKRRRAKKQPAQEEDAASGAE